VAALTNVRELSRGSLMPLNPTLDLLHIAPLALQLWRLNNWTYCE
jgi:hypothetical protein